MSRKFRFKAERDNHNVTGSLEILGIFPTYAR